MSNLNLILYGTFCENEPESHVTFCGENSIVKFFKDNHRTSYEVWKAIRRIMWDFSKFKVYPTEIYTPEKEQVMIFCKEDLSMSSTKTLKKFIYEPYPFEEYLEFEKILTSKETDDLSIRRKANFWWYISSKPVYYNLELVYYNWIAFMESNKELFIKTITNDHDNWWNKEPEIDRLSEHKRSLR